MGIAIIHFVYDAAYLVDRKILKNNVGPPDLKRSRSRRIYKGADQKQQAVPRGGWPESEVSR
jgi:hypothetical protein